MANLRRRCRVKHNGMLSNAKRDTSRTTVRGGSDAIRRCHYKFLTRRDLYYNQPVGTRERIPLYSIRSVHACPYVSSYDYITDNKRQHRLHHLKRWRGVVFSFSFHPPRSYRHSSNFVKRAKGSSVREFFIILFFFLTVVKGK